MLKVLLLLSMLSSCVLFASPDRYEARSTAEIQAQSRLLNELYDNKGISETLYKTESERLREITYTLTYGQLPKQLTEAENIVLTEKIDWLSTGLIALGVLIGLWVIIPLIKKLFYLLLVSIVYLQKGVLKLAPWLPRVVSLIGRFLRTIKDSIVTTVETSIEFIKQMPVVIWEAISYVLLFTPLLFVEHFYAQLALTLLLSALISRSLHYHYYHYKSAKYANILLMLLSLLWTATAYYFSSSIMGFVAVGLINALLGFSLGIYPGLMTVGFKNNEQGYIFKTSLTSLALLLVGWLVFYSRLLPNSIGIEVFMFAAGLFFFVPLSFYVAITIISGWWFDDDKYYLLYNMYAFFSGLSLLLLAYIYGMGFLFWIGTVFMVWHIFAKYYELVWKEIQPVYSLTILAAILGGSGYMIQNNLQAIVDYMAPVL